MADIKEVNKLRRLQRLQLCCNLQRQTYVTPQPENTTQLSAKDSDSKPEQEIWSFDRAINEGFRLLPQELCPRPSEEHTPAKPLSGIEH